MVNSKSLLLLLCTVLVAGAISGSDDTRHHRLRPEPPCCLAVTKGNMSAEVVGQTYRELAARGDCLKAILFYTKDGKKLCADPDAQWVKDLTARMTKE